MKKVQEILTCPKCGSDDITVGERETSDNVIIQESSCDTCDAAFREIYTISAVYQYDENGTPVLIRGD